MDMDAPCSSNSIDPFDDIETWKTFRIQEKPIEKTMLENSYMQYMQCQRQGSFIRLIGLANEGRNALV